MNIYTGYDSYAGSSEGACLIFAHTAKEARLLAWPVLQNWFDSEWIDIRARRIIGEDHLRELANADFPHVIESPPVCDVCETWGGGEPDEDGRCANCEWWD